MKVLWGSGKKRGYYPAQIVDNKGGYKVQYLEEARSSPAGSLAESHSAIVRAAWHEETSPIDTVGFRSPDWGAIRRPTPRCRADRGRSF